MNKVIVLGFDHTNSLGVAQALGIQGIDVYTVVMPGYFSEGVVSKSSFVKAVIYSENDTKCLENILSLYTQGARVIIPACDDAARFLDRHRNELSGFLFENAECFTIEDLVDKQLQVNIAQKSGLKVPLSVVIDSKTDLESVNITYPCIFKPLVSSNGSKTDITICHDKGEFMSKAKDVLSHTSQLMLQQYINKDVDYVVCGCSLRDGNCVIPTIISKIQLYPAKVGLGTVYYMEPLYNDSIIAGINSFMKTVGYEGLFSVEFARNINDGEMYFIETNFRNDGVTPCLTHSGINLPYIHFCDLIGVDSPAFSVPDKYSMICEIRHLQSMIHGDISVFKWIKDIVNADCFMTYYKNDKHPIISMLTKSIKSKIKKA